MFYKYRNKKVLPCSSADEEALNTKTKLDLTKLFYSCFMYYQDFYISYFILL